MGVKAGLDPRIMLDVINVSSGRNTATEQKFPEVVLPRTFNQGFTAGLMIKDVNLFVSEAKALGVPIECHRGGRRLAQAHLRRDSARTRTSPRSCSRSRNAPASKSARPTPNRR